MQHSSLIGKFTPAGSHNHRVYQHQLSCAVYTHLAGPAALVGAEEVEVHHTPKLSKHAKQCLGGDHWSNAWQQILHRGDLMF
jgi:hypothetical protein